MYHSGTLFNYCSFVTHDVLTSVIHLMICHMYVVWCVNSADDRWLINRRKDVGHWHIFIVAAAVDGIA